MRMACIRDKVLSVNDGYLLMSRGYDIYKYDIQLGKSELYAKLINDKYRRFSRGKLSHRLMRAEITGLYILSEGVQLAIAKKGLFLKQQGSDLFKKVFDIPRGSRPLNICRLPNGHLFFGEYFQNIDKQEVHIYQSIDDGMSWNIIYTFPKGMINHVHGLFYDKYTSNMWAVTGDRENECIIGYTSDEFKTFVEVFRGGQEYRSCQLFFYQDFIVFATDSQYVENEIKYFDRKNLQINSLTKIQGTAIKGGQVGNVSFLSTTVEPSEVNKDKKSHLWYTKDGLNWYDAIAYQKDIWPAILQFGSIEFPQYSVTDIDKIYFSGRALKKLDGKTSYIEIK